MNLEKACNCPDGPCEHFPYPARGFLQLCRAGKSGLSRDREIQTLLAFAAGRDRLKESSELPSSHSTKIAGFIPRAIGVARPGHLIAPQLQPINVTKAPKQSSEGIGTELTLVLDSLGLKGYGGCKCKAIADWMNRIGLQGCLENREVILAKLRKAQQDLGWLDEKKAQFLGLIKGLAFKLDRNDPAPGLLDEAIHRWKEKHPDKS